MIKKYSHLIIAGCLCLTLFSLPFIRCGKIIDNLSAGIVYRLNKKNTTAAKNIVLVAVDDRTLQKINQKWPFSRSLYAQAINILNEENAKVVGIDLILAGEGASSGDDEMLTNTLKKLYGKIILAYRVDSAEGILTPAYPAEKFRLNAAIGIINAPADYDNSVRKLRTRIKFRDFDDFSFAVKIAAAAKESSPLQKDNYVYIADKKIPVDKAQMMNLTYIVKPDDIATISFSDLLARKFSKNTFAEKIVLIAATSEVIHDIIATPLGRMPGVFIHINGLTDILEDKVTETLPDYLTFIIFAAALLAAGLVLVNFPFLKSAWYGATGITAVLLGLNVLLRSAGWSFDIDRIISGTLAYLAAGNIASYFRLFAFIEKIKNKLVTDPVTNLASVRYFYERMNFAARTIPRREKYLIAVLLEGSDAMLQNAGFAQTKDFWQGVSQILFAYAKTWAKAREDLILGALARKDDAVKIHRAIKGIFFEKGIRVKIKTGAVELKYDADITDILPVFAEKLEKAQEEISFFPADTIYSPAARKTKTGDTGVSSLYLETEDKARELLDTIEKLKNQEQKIKSVYFELINSLVAALESKDPYTTGHSQRVCKYAVALAEKLNLNAGEIEKIRKAALLHDLGKIGIPDGILHKKGKLSDDEFAIIKEHEVISAKILEPMEEFKDIIPYILHHHEKFDGTGYPHGLAGNMIPLGARVISLADVFDALVTGRDYKNAFSVAAATEEIEKGKGRQFDPALAETFIQTLKDAKIL